MVHLQQIISIDTDIAQNRCDDHTGLEAFRQLLVNILFLLHFLAQFALDPAFRRRIWDLFLILLHLRKELRNTTDATLLAVFWGTVDGGDITQRRARLEERQKRRGELVRHVVPSASALNKREN